MGGGVEDEYTKESRWNLAVNVTIFPKLICPECQNPVLQLSQNKIFECCGKKFLVMSRPDGYIIKEVAISYCKSCKKINIIVKKVY